MKWSIFVCLVVCLAKFCDGFALKCPPGVTDPSCTEDIKEVDTHEPLKTEPMEVQCLVGSEWESNCHYCRCSDEGVAECLKQNACDKGVFAEPVLCKPNTTFQRDCNTCICLENGLGLCTLEFCRRSDSLGDTPLILGGSEFGDSKDESTLKSVKTDAVVPNQDRHDEENFLNLDHDLVILKRSTICKPLEEFMRDCNPCKCARDGLSYSCTHNECLEAEMDKDKEVEVFMQSEGEDHVERHSVCRASNTFYIGCNTCHCNALGTDYTCTNKPCPLPADVELFHELKATKSTQSSKNVTKSQVCEANRMFIKDCNTCWCNEDGTGYYCTRRVCVPLLPDENADLGGLPTENVRVKECRPNEVFELECNMCRCNPDGKSYACTRRACETQFGEKKNVTLSRKIRAFTTEPPKACQPGQEFRMDCNKCLCDDKGQDFSCTRNDCNAANNNHHASAFTAPRSKRDVSENASTKCVPGTVFNEDCNVCRCTDRQQAICTLHLCKEKENKAEEHASETDQGFRCNAGEQFKQDCNDCTCSADGRSVFCTLRLCDQDLTPDI